METISRYSLVLLALAIGCNGQDLIGPTQPTQAVVMGNTHTLSCSRGSGVTIDVAWVEDVQGGLPVTISLGSDIRNTEPKYSNFKIDTNNDNGVDFNLEISDAAVEDEGVYFCQLFATSTSSETVTLAVEVRSSSMEMKQDDISVTEVTLTENLSSNITCTALGARPVVEIWWYHQQIGGSETRIMTGVTQTDTSNGDTFDTISTLQYTASKTYDKGSIRCETTGQEVAESRSFTAAMMVQYPPDVSVQYGGGQAICSSVANPDVPLKGYADMQGYIFIVNGTEYAPTECPASDGQCILNLEVKFNTDLRCNATNSIGTGFDTTVAIPGAVITTTPEPFTTPNKDTTIGDEGDDSNVAAIVGAIVGVVLVIVIVGLLAYYFLVFKKKGNKTTNGGRDTELKPSNGSKKDKPVPAPRTNSKGDVYHDDEGKKGDGIFKVVHHRTAEMGSDGPAANNDNTDGLHYADLDLRPQKGSQPTNNIIRTDEPTEYADVKTFIV